MGTDLRHRKGRTIFASRDVISKTNQTLFLHLFYFMFLFFFFVCKVRQVYTQNSNNLQDIHAKSIQKKYASRYRKEHCCFIRAYGFNLSLHVILSEMDFVANFFSSCVTYVQTCFDFTKYPQRKISQPWILSALQK